MMFSIYCAYLSTITLLVFVSSSAGWNLERALQTNSISEADEREVLLRTDKLPVCHQRVICAYLQTNARGINVKHLCRCPGNLRCPTSWDPEDGRSVTQGSDQYKFCEEAPELKPCEASGLAYSSVDGYSAESGDLLFSSHHVHCACPAAAKIVSLNTDYREDVDGIDLLENTFVCEPLKMCEEQDSCKALAERPGSFFVTTQCTCPRGSSCPTLSRYRIKTTQMGKGFIHEIRCH